jgi:hypothetical protein
MANDKRFVVKNGLQSQNIDFKSPDGEESALAEMLNDGNLVLSTASGPALTINDLSVTHNTPTIFEDETQGLLAEDIELGENTEGSYTSNPVFTLTTETGVSNATALINEVLGKLVPDPPPDFPNGVSLSIQSINTFRMCDFVQTDNTPGNNKNVAGGTTVSSILRSTTYNTNTIAGTGPGNKGTVSVYKNGTVSGTRALTTTQDPVTLLGTDAGTYNDLIIISDRDWSLDTTDVYSPDGFWQSISLRATGTISSGWNEVYIDHTEANPTNTVVFYCDTSNPGSPQVTNVSITPTTTNLIYSSTIPHYVNTSVFTFSFDVNRLSGDTYPVSNNFITGSARGAFSAPQTLTYAGAGITTPLARNLYVASGAASVSTTANVRSGFGISSLGPSISIPNGYQTTNTNLDPTVSILYKTGTSNTIEETSILVTGVGVGSGNATRIEFTGGTDTPTISSTTPFNSQNSTLQTYDATVVNSSIRHDQTNYSTGYLPVGPNLSSGRSGSQYFTLKFVRTTVSKFDVRYTGTIAGLWVALPGSSIDTTSTLNGWLNASQSYNGSGLPGAGPGGNGSNGCALGGVAVLNSSQTNRNVTVTFGTANSTNTATNEILVRIRLTSGQSLTDLSIRGATN